MPNEPEREIEKQLRASAQARRDAAGAPRTMPPVTRKILQAEIARAHPPKLRGWEYWSQLLVVFWPRLAIGVAMIALGLVMMVHFERPSTNTLGVTEYARNDAQPSAARKLETADEKSVALPSVAPAAAPSPAAKLDGAMDQLKPGAMSVSKDEPQIAAANGNPSQSEANSEATKKALTARRASETTDLPPPASPAPATVALDDRAQGTTFGVVGGSAASASVAPVTQAYSQVNVAANAKQAQNQNKVGVLNNFRLEQSGNNLRVVDSDGSIYIGSVEPAGNATNSYSFALPAAKLLARTRDKEAAQLSPNAALAIQSNSAQSNQSQNAAQNYFFRVRGTNRSLQQEVVFSGRVENATLSLGTDTYAGGVNGPMNKTSIAPSLLLLNSRVSGQAVVNFTNQLDIIAEPAKP